MSLRKDQMDVRQTLRKQQAIMNGQYLKEDMLVPCSTLHCFSRMVRKVYRKTLLAQTRYLNEQFLKEDMLMP